MSLKGCNCCFSFSFKYYLCFAVVNCVLGVFLDHMSMKSIGWFVFIPYGVALVLVLLFEMFIFIQRYSKLKPVAKTNIKDEKVAITTPPPPKLTSEVIMGRYVF